MTAGKYGHRSRKPANHIFIHPRSGWDFKFPKASASGIFPQARLHILKVLQPSSQSTTNYELRVHQSRTAFTDMVTSQSEPENPSIEIPSDDLRLESWKLMFIETLGNKSSRLKCGNVLTWTLFFNLFCELLPFRTMGGVSVSQVLPVMILTGEYQEKRLPQNTQAHIQLGKKPTVKAPCTCPGLMDSHPEMIWVRDS